MGIERNLIQLSQLFSAHVDAKSFERLAELCEVKPKSFKVPADDNRLYPHVFGPVIVGQKTSSNNVERVIKPMRYRVRPSDAQEEVPSKFNLFNARLDALESRKTWRPLFGRKHGLFPYKRFYEWVETNREGVKEKQLVSFKPTNHDFLMAPVLFDFYEQGEESFYSFAIITTDPPDEVLAAGHDRCPVFIKEDYWDKWLNPQESSRDELYDVLNDPLRPFYEVSPEESPQRKGNKTQANDTNSQLNLFDYGE